MKNHLPFFAAAAMAVALDAAAQSTIDSVLTNGLADPRGVTLFENNAYIADSGSHRVLKYALDTGALTTLAGVSGKSGTNNGPGFVARFFSPKSIVSALGGLVVSDSDNHSLRFIDVHGTVPLVINLAGLPGQPGFTEADAVSGGVDASVAHFNTPIGLATDRSGNIYIADSKNNCVRMLTQIGGVNRVVTIATGFLEPTAVAVGDQTGNEIDLFVADTRNHAIKVFRFDTATRLMTTNKLSNGQITVSLIAGSGSRVSGTDDSLFAEEALFNLPSALMWSGAAVGLIVSDTGNHTLRRVYQDPIFQDPIFQDPEILQFFEHKDLTNRFSVETYAGRPTQSGFTDGPLKTARFNSPSALVRDAEGDLLIVDSGNNTLRRIQITPRLPRVHNPTIGWVDFVKDEVTGEFVSSLVPVTSGIFNNDVVIAVLPEENSQSYYTYGTTPGLFGKDTIESPTQKSALAPPYRNGLKSSEVPSTLVAPAPDLTIKAISTAERRSPSEVVQARFRFQCAPPTFSGDNPASVTLKTATRDAIIYYDIVSTNEDSVPTEASVRYPPKNISIFTFPVTNAVTVRARAFKPNYKPSDVSAKTFLPENFRPNQIAFGFEAGEASSEFVGSAGQNFIAPVTLSLLPNQKVYTLQFNLMVTNRNGAASLSPGAFGFQSMLVETVLDASQGVFFDRVIPPQVFERFQLDVITNVVPTGTLITTNFIPVFRNLLFTNGTQNLLGVGWLEVVGRTNLYNSRAQDLVATSRAHDREFLGSQGKVVLGGYSFQIPIAAASGSTYRIQVGRPSGSDAVAQDVFIDTPNTGSLGSGSINAIKDVTVVAGGTGPGQLYYLVGDVTPFRWYNAGDFGDTNILNSDVYQVFRAADYNFNVPPAGTDFFDAMDACCLTSSGTTLTNVFDGSDAGIDQIALGDGVLNVTDVFVTFRRSLDPSLKWYARYWVNGQRQASAVPNLFRGKLQRAVPGSELSQANSPAETMTATSPGLSAVKPFVTFQADDIRLEPGQTVLVPIRAEVAGPSPARVLMLNVTVEPLEGAPPLKETVQFTPAPQLGRPTLTDSISPGNYAAAWLDERATGLQGSTAVGSLRVAVPASAPVHGTYRIHFNHVSASPNGLSVLPQRVEDGLLAGADHSGSSFSDGIPDAWRLRYFGTVFNCLSQANADADGDGLSNWAEYKAGTNPNDVASQLRVRTSRTEPAKGLTLRWPSSPNKIYTIEAASQLYDATWITLGSKIVGTGREMEFEVNPADGSAQFYRVRLIE